ncbi:MAG: M20 family metallopeptidase [Thermoplasmata archaeon]
MVRSLGRWGKAARRIRPQLEEWRASFHREPELSDREFKTRDKVVRALNELGIPARTYPNFNGVLGLLGTDRTGPVVALRADMDALPVTERTGLPFASIEAGRMHACGHDIHMAALLGAGAILRASRTPLRGPVKLIFQPAEEEGTMGGAAPFLARGAFRRPKVDYVVGLHVEPTVPLGKIGWRVGPVMAAADHFRLTIRGTAGHAGTPHRGPDAILVAAEVVNGVQALVSRVRNPLDPVVISIGMIHGGTRHNILPASVELQGTVRTFQSTTRDRVELVFRRRVGHLVKSLGASVRIEYIRGYPVTINDPTATSTVVDALRNEFGPDALIEMPEPMMAAEDFSRYLEVVPGTFLFLGVATRAPQASLHSPTFAPDQSAVSVGAAALSAAVERLQRSPP